MAGFDLEQATSAVAAEDEGQQIHVLDQHGEPLYAGQDKPVTITVAGTYSQRYRRAEESQANRRIKGRRNQTVTAADLRAAQLDIAAACVIAWDGFHSAGTPLDCTKDNVRKVLEAAPWIREQVERAMEDHAGFFVRSSSD